MKEHVGRDRARGQHDPDQTLGHDGEGRGRPGDKHPAAPPAFFGVSLRDGKREYRCRHEKSQGHVQRQDMADDDVEGAARGHRRAAERGRWSEQALARPEDEHHAEKTGQAGPQARGPFVLSEHAEGHGGRPVLQRRLLEIFVPVQARREPVAARDHLARNLGVAPLVGLHQVPITEIAEPDGRE